MATDQWQDLDVDSAPGIESALTAQQMAAVMAANPLSMPQRFVLAQVLLGCALAGLAWLLFGALVARSVLCGVLAAALPAALFLRSLKGSFARISTKWVVLKFLVWELIKIAATVAMILLARQWIEDLNWLAMLIGLIITLKLHWLLLLLPDRQQQLRSLR